MKKSILVDLLKLSLLGVAIFALFYFYPIFPDKPELDISIANEEKLGKLIVEDILSHDPSFKKLDNPALDSALCLITSRLTDSIGLTDYEFHFRVLDNPAINAVTLPGGNIFIFKGLIEFSESPEEVAAVIAHELGHVQKRHVVHRLVREFGISVVLTVLGGGDNVMLSELGRTALSTAFDRDEEKDADRFGLDLLVKSQISPKALAVFFRRLSRKYNTMEKVHENFEFMMTHPHNNSRIKMAMEYPLPAGFQPNAFTINWESMKNSL
ncbi:MAG: M48 family metallopeptidase [Bacteroidetes bacterium]|nr:M48 family metallopeptidase [Bacteroidota bacterium]